MFRLTHGSIDDEDERSFHETRRAAIEAAVCWFVDGYDNDTIPPLDLTEDIVDLRRALAHGDSYHCGRFHENITLVELTDGEVEFERVKMIAAVPMAFDLPFVETNGAAYTYVRSVALPKS